MEVYLILVTAMTTLCGVSLGCTLYLLKLAKVKSEEAVTLASDMRTAYNAQTEVIETLVAKVTDLELGVRLRK
jgi:hypothetical protein